MDDEMHIYNFKRLWYLIQKSVFKTKGTIARLTLKRMLLLAVFFLLYGPLEVITWCCFALDRIFFPGFREVEIKSPVFIIGNPRSGTTFLHRLMAMDKEQFIPILMWEIIFAPSIIQRKIWGSLVRLDKWLGHPVRNLVRRLEARLFDPHKMHRIRLRMPEEDEYLMMHDCTTILAGFFFGIPELSIPFVKFDESLSSREKSRTMRFYKKCIQRHMYYHGQNRIFLSKNPFFSPKIDILLREFPDAFFIYLIRNPLNAVPSFASTSAFWWHVFCDTKVQYPYPDFIMKTMQYWYRYPLDRLEKDTQACYLILKFDDMVGNPQHAVEKIYDRLGIEVSPSFAEILDEETLKSKQYKSRHQYSLEAIGYTREQILHEFNDVFQRWHFDEDA